MDSPSPAPSDRARQLLDKALDGESEEIRARVLRLVLDMGIPADEEFFLVCVAMGHLKCLLWDAPQHLKAWSKALQEELDVWQASHMHTLQLIAEKGEATAALSETAAQLTSNLTSMTQVCNALMRQLQTAYLAQGKTWEQQDQVNQSLLSTLAVIQQQVQALSKAVKQHSGKPSITVDPLLSLGLKPSGPWKQAVIWAAVFYAVVSSAAFTTMAIFYIRDRQHLLQATEKVDYLLEKQNRRDCREGMLPAKSPLCG